MKNDVFKLGMSRKRDGKRLKSYGLKCIIYSEIHVYDPQSCENRLLTAFKKKFGDPVNGRETFQGTPWKIHSTFGKVTEKHLHKTGIPPTELDNDSDLSDSD